MSSFLLRSLHPHHLKPQWSNVLNILKTKHQQRNILTESLVPFSKSIVCSEKTYTVVLLEDEAFYNKPASWNSILCKSFPEKYCTNYCYQNLPMSDLRSSIEEMREDLRTYASVVMIARGPLVSYVSQFYLESLSLSGLIMVDPFSEPSPEILTEIRERCHGNDGANSSTKIELLDKLESGEECRKLKLEPGVVPMLILSSSSLGHKDIMKKASEHTAERHSDLKSPFEVRLEHIEGEAPPLGIITNWIDAEKI